MLHREWVAAAIVCQGEVLEGKTKEPSKGISELLPGYISTILGAGQDSDPPTALTGPFQFPFGLLSQSCLQIPQPPLLPTHTPLLSRILPLPHLSGM